MRKLKFFISLALIFSLVNPAYAWYSGYSYRKKLTIDHTKFDDTLTNFPVNVKLSDNNFDFTKVLSTEYDVNFTQSDGDTAIPFERVRPHSTSDLATGLVGHWKKNDNLATTNVIDAKNAYNGTMQHGNTVDHKTAGVSANTGGATGAITFNGANDYILADDQDDFSFGDGAGNDVSFSASFWIYQTAIGSYDRVIAKGVDWASSNMEWCIISGSASANTPALYLFTNGNGNYIRRYASSALSTNAWHNIIVTYNGSKVATGIKIYDNLVRIDSTSSGAGSYTGMANTTQKLSLGASNDGSNKFTGYLDDVRIYKNVVLNASQREAIYKEKLGTERESATENISAIYYVNAPSVSKDIDTDFYVYYGKTGASDASNANGTWDSDFVGVWHLLDNVASTAVAESTSALSDGTASANTDTLSVGEKGMYFGASNVNINCATDSDLNPPHADAITISAIVTLESVDEWEKMICKPYIDGAWSDPWAHWELCKRQGDRKLCFGFSTGGAGTYTYTQSATSLGTLAETYVATKYDGEHINYYFNATAETPQDETGSIQTLSTNTPTYISAHGAAGSNTEWHGQIREMRVSKIVRSDAWLKAEYNDSVGVVTYGSEETAPVGGGHLINAGFNEYFNDNFEF